MKKFISLLTLFIFSACTTPQVTVTSQVTVTLAPPTSIPTPTLHPEFIAWQELISPSARYTLTPDGFIQDNSIVIDGLQVDSNGVMTLTVNNEKIILTVNDVSFNEDGIQIKGYELNENGTWVEAVNAEQVAIDLLDQYGVDPETVTVTEEGELVKVTDAETGTILFETDGEQTKYGLTFSADVVAKASCEPTEFKPDSNGLLPGASADVLAETAKYFDLIGNAADFKRWTGITHQYFLIDRERQCWGIFYQTNREDADKDKVILYRDAEGVAQVVPLLDAITWDEIYDFAGDR